ncbi:hypothetical protein [Streptomyces sp. NBC_00239]|uniref:hypothetical protein n=1 Tax=Streptomyces sp. NBC_00239 TaxID=2903640 RepID=UPI002E2A726A|nr:hypothetical protein [Streptomyces sp. NBC_00239]
MRYVSSPFLDPAERLLLGIPPERAVDTADPLAWARLDRRVCRETDPEAPVPVRRPSSPERPDWSTAPRWDGAARPPGVAWSADPPAAAELALGLCHHDPRVREQALALTAERPRLHTEVRPLLLIRCADAHPPARARARDLLAETAPDLPAEAAGRLLPLAALLSLREHGGWVWDYVTARLGGVPAARLLELTESDDRRVREAALRLALHHRLLPPAAVEAVLTGAGETRIRRVALDAALRDGLLTPALAETLVTRSPDGLIRHTALDAALRDGLLHARRLAELAGRGSDPVVRRRCLAGALDAVGTDDPAGVLDVLAAASSAVVRSSAVTALHRVGRGAEARAYLGDPSARVRSAARLVLRLRGEDPAAHYRALCADPAAPGLAPGLAFGLAESAGPEAAALLRRMTRHAEGRVRAAALAALRMADAVSPDELMAFMTDPHPPVVRVARKALVPYVLLLPEGWLAELVAPGRPRHTRRAGLRLLSAHGLDLRKRVLADLEDDEDPEVRYEAQRARYERGPQ